MYHKTPEKYKIKLKRILKNTEVQFFPLAFYDVYFSKVQNTYNVSGTVFPKVCIKYFNVHRTFNKY